MRVWWCNQSRMWDIEYGNGIVCSSDESEDGGNTTYRKTVGEASGGDLIVHYNKPYVVAFSRALENGRYFPQLPLLQGEDHYGAGWRFRAEYHVLKERVPRESFSERLIPLRVKHYPIDGRGFARQGYFFPFDLEGLSVILSLIDEELPDWLDIHRPKGAMIPEEIVGGSVLWEGAVSRITVNAYERNPEARRRCIEHYGTNCSVCDFDFGKHYGDVAEGVIQVHHLKPLSQVEERYEVDPIKDLRPVCPNCHIVIHLRKDPPYSIEEVQAFLRNSSKNESE